MKLYFSHDPEDGFELHDTEAEARKRADAIMESCSDYAADDGWPDNMGEVCWGEVRQVAYETRRWEAEEGSGFDYMAEWELAEVKPEPERDAAGVVLDSGRALLHRAREYVSCDAQTDGPEYWRAEARELYRALCEHLTEAQR